MLVKNRFLFSYRFILIVAATLAISCGSDNNPEIKEKETTEPPVENTEEDNNSDTTASAETIEMHQWMLREMRQKYLWNEDIPNNVSVDTEDTEAFFKSMLSQNDGKHTDGNNYFYSYIENDTKYSLTRALQSGNTYGMYLVWYRLTTNNGAVTNNLAARVLYVCDDSSASDAGIERGDWIWKIDKAGRQSDITSDLLNSFYSGSGIDLYITRDGKEVSLANLQKVTIAASKEMKISPVFRTKVVDVENKKVGYLCYNAFVSGKTPFETFEYDDELVEAFKTFKTQQIDELVLDLRYNGGGSLTSAGILSYMIAPSAALNDIIWILTKKNNYKDIYKLSLFNTFYKQRDGNISDLPNLNLSNLYCLVSSNTASASEAVANGLKEYMNVTLVGSRTEGKDVGMNPIRTEDNKYPYYMWPITFRITSSDTNFHYSDGLVPDSNNTLDEKYIVDEKGHKQDVEMYPLGDSREVLFARALALILGTNITRSSQEIRTYGSVGVEVPAYNTLNRKPWYEKNALLIPNMNSSGESSVEGN